MEIWSVGVGWNFWRISDYLVFVIVELYSDSNEEWGFEKYLKFFYQLIYSVVICNM